MQTSVLLLGLLFLLIFMGVPIGYSMGITAAVTLKALHPGIPLIIIPQRMFGGTNNFILLCIPFFMLAGSLMSLTPLFNKLIVCAEAVVGHIRGGLSHVNIVVSMFFAGITGAAVADTAAVGSLLIPAMVEEGYTKSYATAVTVTSSTIGVIIPPSNLMVVAALASSTSVPRLFLGGFIPGILSGLAQLVISLYKTRGFPKRESMTWKQRAKIFWEGGPALVMPLIIMGGILGGIVTPTEAANISVVYAAIVGGIMVRKNPPSLAVLQEACEEVVSRLAAVMLCVGAAVVLGWVMAIADVPEAIGELIMSVTTSPALITAGMLITYVVVGTFLDPIPGILIFTPIFLPIARQIGIDTVHFAVTMVFGLALGLATPPVGSCLYVGSAISGLPVDKFAKDLVPFVISIIVVLFLIAYFPPLITFLPSLFMK